MRIERGIDPIGESAPVDAAGTTPLGWSTKKTSKLTNYNFHIISYPHLHTRLHLIKKIGGLFKLSYHNYNSLTL